MKKIKAAAYLLLLTLVMASPSRAIQTVTQNFNSSSQAPNGRSNVIRFSASESMTYTTTGTFTQVLVLEQSFDGVNWKNAIVTSTSPTSATTVDVAAYDLGPSGIVYYSWRCSSFTSGSSTVTLATADNAVQGFTNHRGAVSVQINDESLMVNGALKLTPSTPPVVGLGVLYFDAGQNKFLGSTDGAAFSSIGGSGGASVAVGTATPFYRDTSGSVYLATATDNLTVQTTATVQGAAFSVGSSTFQVAAGVIYIQANGASIKGMNYPAAPFVVGVSTNGPAQVVYQNFSQGSNATMSQVFTSPLGGNTTYFFEIGINGNNFNSSPGFTMERATDAFIASSENGINIEANLNGGNPTVNGVINFSVNGANTANKMLSISSTAISAFTPLNMGSNKINSVTDPTSAQDAATKNYVDTSTGTKVLPTKIPARLATTAALAANVYANGSSGVGATLTGAGLGLLTVDGVNPAVGDRVLVNNEVTAANNGIYLVSVNAAGAFYVLTRTVDFDSVSEMSAGEALVVSSGTTNANAFFALIASVTTVGTSPINFSKAVASFAGGSVANTTQFVSSVTFYGDSQSIISTDTYSATQTINWQGRNRKFIQLYGNVTSSVFNNMADGGIYELVLCQDATGSRTFAWPAGTIFPAHGVAPTLTTTANRCDNFTIQFMLFDNSPHVRAEDPNN